MYSILVVEDESDLLDLIEYTLSKEGYDVISCEDTSNVIDILDEEDISLILMDRNLPGIEGSEFIKAIRQAGYNNPVIYVSAKDSDENILEGFESGADDYITKPFDLSILKARVKAVLARTTKKNPEVLRARDIIYDSKKSVFNIDNTEIYLSKLESDLLLYFFQNIDTLLSREMILENVWEDYLDVKEKTVNVAIKRLKEKIDPTDTKGYIVSVRGQGYKFPSKG